MVDPIMQRAGRLIAECPRDASGIARRLARRVAAIALVLSATMTPLAPPQAQALTPPPPPRGKFGCIDAAGRYVIPPIYDRITSCSGPIIAVRRRDREAFFNDHGAMLLPTWFAAPDSINPHVFEHGLEPVGERGHIGYIDRHGVMRIPPLFADADRFLPSGHARVVVGSASSFPPTWALIDTRGRFLIGPRDRGIPDVSPNGLYVFSPIDHGLEGYMDLTGAMRIPARFDLARMFAANGLAAVETGGKWGYVDGTGALVIPARYDDALDFGRWAPHGLAAVMLDGRQCFIDQNGRTVATLDPGMKVFANFSHGLAQAGPDHIDRGFIDEHGRTVIPPKFDAESDFSANGTAAVEVAGKWGYIDKKGRFVIQPQFDGARAFAPNGLASVALGDKLGYVDRHGRIVIPPRFDSSESFGDNGLALVEVDRPAGPPFRRSPIYRGF